MVSSILIGFGGRGGIVNQSVSTYGQLGRGLKKIDTGHTMPIVGGGGAMNSAMTASTSVTNVPSREVQTPSAAHAPSYRAKMEKLNRFLARKSSQLTSAKTAETTSETLAQARIAKAEKMSRRPGSQVIDLNAIVDAKRKAGEFNKPVSTITPNIQKTYPSPYADPTRGGAVPIGTDKYTPYTDLSSGKPVVDLNAMVRADRKAELAANVKPIFPVGGAVPMTTDPSAPRSKQKPITTTKILGLTIPNLNIGKTDINMGALLGANRTAVSGAIVAEKQKEGAFDKTKIDVTKVTQKTYPSPYADPTFGGAVSLPTDTKYVDRVPGRTEIDLNAIVAEKQKEGVFDKPIFPVGGAVPLVADPNAQKTYPSPYADPTRGGAVPIGTDKYASYTDLSSGKPVIDLNAMARADRKAELAANVKPIFPVGGAVPVTTDPSAPRSKQKPITTTKILGLTIPNLNIGKTDINMGALLGVNRTAVSDSIKNVPNLNTSGENAGDVVTAKKNQYVDSAGRTVVDLNAIVAEKQKEGTFDKTKIDVTKVMQKTYPSPYADPTFGGAVSPLTDTKYADRMPGRTEIDLNAIVAEKQKEGVLDKPIFSVGGAVPMVADASQKPMVLKSAIGGINIPDITIGKTKVSLDTLMGGSQTVKPTQNLNIGGGLVESQTKGTLLKNWLGKIGQDIKTEWDKGAGFELTDEGMQLWDKYEQDKAKAQDLKVMWASGNLVQDAKYNAWEKRYIDTNETLKNYLTESGDVKPEYILKSGKFDPKLQRTITQLDGLHETALRNNWYDEQAGTYSPYSQEQKNALVALAQSEKATSSMYDTEGNILPKYTKPLPAEEDFAQKLTYQKEQKIIPTLKQLDTAYSNILPMVPILGASQIASRQGTAAVVSGLRSFSGSDVAKLMELPSKYLTSSLNLRGDISQARDKLNKPASTETAPGMLGQKGWTLSDITGYTANVLESAGEESEKPLQTVVNFGLSGIVGAGTMVYKTPGFLADTYRDPAKAPYVIGGGVADMVTQTVGQFEYNPVGTAVEFYAGGKALGKATNIATKGAISAGGQTGVIRNKLFVYKRPPHHPVASQSWQIEQVLGGDTIEGARGTIQTPKGLFSRMFGAESQWTRDYSEGLSTYGSEGQYTTISPKFGGKAAVNEVGQYFIDKGTGANLPVVGPILRIMRGRVHEVNVPTVASEFSAAERAAIYKEWTQSGRLSKPTYSELIKRAGEKSKRIDQPVATVTPKHAKGHKKPELEAMMIFGSDAAKRITGSRFKGLTDTGVIIRQLAYGSQKLPKQKMPFFMENIKYNIQKKKYYSQAASVHINRYLDEMTGRVMTKPGGQYGAHGAYHYRDVQRQLFWLRDKSPTIRGQITPKEAKTASFIHDAYRIYGGETELLPHGEAVSMALDRGYIKHPILKDVSPESLEKISGMVEQHTRIKPGFGTVGLKTKLLYRPNIAEKAFATADRAARAAEAGYVRSGELFVIPEKTAVGRIGTLLNADRPSKQLIELLSRELMEEGLTEINRAAFKKIESAQRPTRKLPDALPDWARNTMAGLDTNVMQGIGAVKKGIKYAEPSADYTKIGINTNMGASLVFDKQKNMVGRVIPKRTQTGPEYVDVSIGIKQSPKPLEYSYKRGIKKATKATKVMDKKQYEYEPEYAVGTYYPKATTYDLKSYYKPAYPSDAAYSEYPKDPKYTPKPNSEYRRPPKQSGYGGYGGYPEVYPPYPPYPPYPSYPPYPPYPSYPGKPTDSIYPPYPSYPGKPTDSIYPPYEPDKPPEITQKRKPKPTKKRFKQRPSGGKHWEVAGGASPDVVMSMILGGSSGYQKDINKNKKPVKQMGQESPDRDQMMGVLLGVAPRPSTPRKSNKENTVKANGKKKQKRTNK